MVTPEVLYSQIHTPTFGLHQDILNVISKSISKKWDIRIADQGHVTLLYNN